MASEPFFDRIRELRNLKGQPKVTYPNADANFPVTERVVNVRKADKLLDFGSAEPDSTRFPNNILTEQVELSGNELDREVYRKYEIIPGPTKTSTKIGEWGATETITDEEVTPATQAAGGLLVVNDDVQAETALKSRQVRSTVTEWPVLYGTHIDERHAIAINEVKNMEAAGTLGGVIPASGGFAAILVEAQALDKYKTITIASQVDLASLPAEEVIPRSASLSLPDLLLSISGMFDKSEGFGDGFGPDSCQASAHASADGAYFVQLLAGFRGEAKGTMTRTFWSTVPVIGDLPTPTPIYPAHGTVVLTSTGQSKRASATVSSGSIVGESVDITGNVRAHATQVGPCLTGLFVATNTSLAATATGSAYVAAVTVHTTADALATMSVAFPLSTPGYFSSGDVIVQRVNVEKWRFGIYVMEIERAIVP